MVARWIAGETFFWLWLVAFPAHVRAQADLKEVQVSAPTRLDWEFAASIWGLKNAALPKDYDSKQQRYHLFVPKGYDAKRTWPLVVFISPTDHPDGWDGWKKVCSSEGVLFCSPFGAGNNVGAPKRERIILDVLDDVRRHYRIDPDQTYISGHSGGAARACVIGFTLPEWFGGVVPVCGGGDHYRNFGRPTYVRHRIEERLAVACVTGETDINRRGFEEYIFPRFKELKFSTRLWVVPKLGHAIPDGYVFSDVYAWLQAQLKNRREDAKARPLLAMSADETPTPAQQAARQVQAAESELKNPARTWRAVALLQGVVARWEKTETGPKAQQLLKAVLADKKQAALAAEQRAADEALELGSKARSLERRGSITMAIETWELLAKNQPDTLAGRNALQEIKRLMN